MSKKPITYELAQKLVKDKDTAINTFIESSLNKTQQIFKYENLPDTIPQGELENLLQKHGHCIIIEEKGDLYAITGGFSGENDVYNHPRFYTVSNVALGLYRTFEIGVDCVLMKNDFHNMGLLPIIHKYGVLLTDGEISLNLAAILSRITMLISAPDDKTKASADLFVQKIINGDFSVIGENGFFDGVKMQTGSTANTNYITQLIELIQYYKASFLNEIGLNANFNMKRERLNEREVLMNIDNLLPFIENMFSERVNALEKVNEMFGTDIVVDYNGVWKTTHEHADKEEAFAETDIGDETNETDMETELEVGGEADINEDEAEDTTTEKGENGGGSVVLTETEETEETIETEVETVVETEETEETNETEETEETDDETDETKQKRKGAKE